jgi:hypothetical protein
MHSAVYQEEEDILVVQERDGKLKFEHKMFLCTEVNNISNNNVKINLSTIAMQAPRGRGTAHTHF